MKILVAIPTYENICPEVFKSVYDLDKCDHKVGFEAVRGYDTATARNKIVEIAIKGRYDYVLMLDSDTILPKDALKNLLDPQEDIVLGFCPKKNTKNGSSAHIPIDKPIRQIRYADMPTDERVELMCGGMACAFIKTSVFMQMSNPWFRFELMERGIPKSEGYYFCENARQRGYRIWADTRVRCGHLVRYYQYE